jgi:hypothetical protein
MSSPFVAGEIVHVSAEFQSYVDAVLTYVNPDHVYFKYKRPGLDPVTYEYGVDTQLKRSATGKYYVDLDTTGHCGKWYYKFYGTGDNQAAQQGEFEVAKELV